MVYDTSKVGGCKKSLRGGQHQKAGAVVWQWVPTFKTEVPPPPHGDGGRLLVAWVVGSNALNGVSTLCVYGDLQFD